MKTNFTYADQQETPLPLTDMPKSSWGRLYRGGERVGFVYRGQRQFLYFYGDVHGWDEVDGPSKTYRFLPTEPGDELKFTF